METINTLRLEVWDEAPQQLVSWRTARRRPCGVTGTSTWWPVGTRGRRVMNLFKIVTML